MAGYQKMLPLLYLDKLLDEIQRRFRDRFMADLTQKNFFGTTFGGFDNEFEKTLKEVEHASKKIEPQVPRSYKESKKSEKSIGSMMLNKNDEKKDNNCNNTSTAAFSKKAVMTPEIKESNKPSVFEVVTFFRPKCPAAKQAVVNRKSKLKTRI